MGIPTLGLIILTSIPSTGAGSGQVTLDSDPRTYRRSWPRRQSIHEGIGGSVTVQDFGRYAKDMTVECESGDTQYLNLATVRALLGWAGQRGKTWRFRDGEGNDFTVFIEAFDPVQAYGMPDLYTFTLRLRVLGITKLLGQTYTGS